MSISSGRLTQFSFYRWDLHAHSGHFFDPERKGKPRPIYRLELEEKRDLSPVVTGIFSSFEAAEIQQEISERLAE